MSDPVWLRMARSYDGLAEVPGPKSNEQIKAMWLSLANGAWYWSHYKSDDSLLPWCGGAMAYLMQACGIDYPKLYASARSWAEWGKPLLRCHRGSIVVFSRSGGAHVAIADSVDQHGRLLCWGANQKDRVSLAPFLPSRIVARRWPAGVAPPGDEPMPRVELYGAASANEA